MAGGDCNKALLLLEPVEPDVTRIRYMIKSNKNNILKLPFFHDEVVRLNFGKKIFKAAKLMVESRVRHGLAITDRFKLATMLLKDKEPAHFELARYYEELFRIEGASLGMKSNSSVGSAADLEDLASKVTGNFLKNATYAVDHFVTSIASGRNHLMESLPKLITLWLYMTSLPVPRSVINSQASSNRLKGSKTERIGLPKIIENLNALMKKARNGLPSNVWYQCMPQLVSRMGHPNPESLEVIISILLKILIDFPRQAVWHLSSQLNSLNADRRKLALNLLNDAIGKVTEKDGNNRRSKMLADALRLFNSLVHVAKYTPTSKEANNAGGGAVIVNLPIGEGCDLAGFIVPTQAALAMRDIGFSSTDIERTNEEYCNIYFPSDQV